VAGGHCIYFRRGELEYVYCEEYKRDKGFSLCWRISFFRVGGEVRDSSLWKGTQMILNKF
jgi:hypothetical protein